MEYVDFIIFINIYNKVGKLNYIIKKPRTTSRES